MAESKYFPDLQNGVDVADVEQVENAFTMIEADMNGKVDKVTGKGLSTNDFTDSDKSKLDTLENYDDTEIRGLITNENNQIAAALNIMQSDIDSRVEKVDGKGLSTNDYTTEDKTKVDGMYTPDGKLPYDRIPNPTVHGLLTGDVFEVNSIYDLPELASLTITLPSGSVGDWMQVGFISGTTPTNLTINATSSALMSDYDFVPEANTIYTLFFDYGRLSNTAYGWRFSSAEYTYSEV